MFRFGTEFNVDTYPIAAILLVGTAYEQGL